MIVLTGGSGFVGRATLTALARRSILAQDGPAVRLLEHRRPVTASGFGQLERVHADLARPGTLAGLCEGAHALVHLASAIDDDEAICASVNVRGTKALMAEARRADVAQIVYLSTAAVYGRGPHSGIGEDEAAPAPVSPASRSRLLAEQSVLAAGGVVLRPMFIYGPGDTWFVPALARAITRTPVSINGGRARLSLIAVQDLAEVVTSLAAAPGFPRRAGIYHVSHPEPVTLATLLATLTQHLGVPAPAADLSYEAACAFLAGDPTLTRQLQLVAFDHFYSSRRIWRHTGLEPGSLGSRFAAASPWYRAHLGAELIQQGHS